MIEKAVILNAGLGSRLSPLTKEIPKCLTEINGRTILENQLGVLAERKIKEAVIVIGYLGEKIKERFGAYYKSLRITYIENKDYEITGTAKSLYLARKHLKEGCIVIEGDIYFENEIFNYFDLSGEKTCHIASLHKNEDGCIIEKEGDSDVVKNIFITKSPFSLEGDYYKSAGITIVSPDYGEELVKGLKKSKDNEYKDIVMGQITDKAESMCCIVKSNTWHEIDTMYDLHSADRFFKPTKYVCVVLDGAADIRYPQYGDQSPFEWAKMPGLSEIVTQGQTGLVQTMVTGLPLGSIVAFIGLLGFNPSRYYPYGRASFEAVGQNIYPAPDEIVLRANFVKYSETGRLIGNSQYDLSEAEIKKIFDKYKSVGIIRGNGYRNIMVMKANGAHVEHIKFFPPHENIGHSINELYPAYDGTCIHTKTMQVILKNIMLDTFLEFREITERKDFVVGIMPWSPSVMPHLPSFHRRHGKDGAVITGTEFLKGMGRVCRMETQDIPGATSFSDTNLRNKLQYTKNALVYNDFVMVHINAPDEESHVNDFDGKIDILEKIDREYITPIYEHLKKVYGKNFRIAVLPDHYTHVGDGTHGEAPVPYVISGMGLRPDKREKMSEIDIEESAESILKSNEFLDFLFQGESK